MNAQAWALVGLFVVPFTVSATVVYCRARSARDGDAELEHMRDGWRWK